MCKLPRQDIDAVIRGGHVDWDRLRDARLFITGGTGFFGRWVIEALAAADAALVLNLRITLLSRDVGSARRRLSDPHRFSWVEGDVRAFTVPDGSFDYLIHAATDSSQAGQTDPNALTAQIVDGTRRAIDFACRVGIRRCLYVSSGAVYGTQPPSLAAIPETWPGHPAPGTGSAYGLAKLAAESLILEASKCGNFEAVVARPFAFVGPGLPLDTHFAVGNFIRDALQGSDIIVTGDGRPMRSYLYAGDLAGWLLAMLVRGDTGGIYNVGSDEAVSIADLATLVASVIPSAGRVVVQGEGFEGADRHRYVPSIDKARRTLGLDVWTPLETAIRKTADYALASPG